MENFEIQVKRLDYLYTNLLNGLIAIFSMSLIMLFTFYNIVDTQNLLIWFFLQVVLLVFRYYLYLLYKADTITKKNFFKYHIKFFISASLNAILWGSIVFYIFPQSIEYQVIIVLLVSGLISGSAISLSSRVEMFYTYLLLALSPYVYHYMVGDTTASKVLAFSILLYISILFILSKKISFGILNNIKLAHQNEKLIEELEKKAQEAQSANKAKSEFLSVMSHEIRTPLNAIMGFVQILQKAEKDEKKKNYLDIINNSSNILINIINDILDVAKIESGKFTLEMREFNPKEEFESLYILFERNANEKNLTLINSISPDLPECIISDILRIKQILSNLLSNAIKFTPGGKNIELLISFDKEHSSLHFEVIDEGIGISQKNSKNVTEAFIQADSSTARKYGGTGLGLAIVTNLLKLFSSKLKLQSELDVGSKFSFDIRVEVTDKNSTEVQTVDEVNFEDTKILIAEDNKTNQMLISILLEDMNIDISMANDGVEAVEIFKKESFDVVLMDINMPNKNGIDAMLEIKEYEKNQPKKTPIVSLTANATSGDKEKYLQEGFDAYLAKPIDNQELVKILQKFCNVK